ncbi:MAG: fluoride efflux transporter CrcB [Solirubrobacteraceae bacterium]
MSWCIWIAVGLIGRAGASARLVLDGAVSSRATRSFPLGTFVVNSTGALALGVVSGIAVRGEALVLVGAALIGSYTTFSTWMLETRRLAEDGAVAAAAVNVLLGLGVGLGGALLGRAIGGQL